MPNDLVRELRGQCSWLPGQCDECVHCRAAAEIERLERCRDGLQSTLESVKGEVDQHREVSERAMADYDRTLTECDALRDALRPELWVFANMMEAALREHDRERGDSWKDLSVEECLDGISRESEELDEAVKMYSYDEIATEAVDVANFAMFAARDAITRALLDGTDASS